jgi:hypothetical protein
MLSWLPWLVALAGVSALPLALLWRWGSRRREDLEARVADLEGKLDAAVAEGRRGAETAALLQRLLIEKGLADVEDFDDGRPDGTPAPSAPRGRDLH